MCIAEVILYEMVESCMLQWLCLFGLIL